MSSKTNDKLKKIKSKEKNNYSGLLSKLVICGEYGRTMTTCRAKKDSLKKLA